MKGAPGVIDELVSKDVNSFPREDPAILAARAKQMLEDEKIRKEHERQRKQEEKEEAAQVKKAAATKAPVRAVEASPKQQAAARELKAMKIRLYFRHLKHKIGIKEPAKLPTEDAELDSLLLSIEAELQSAGGVEIASNIYTGGVSAFEALTQHYNPLNLHLSGPVASLAGTVQANKKQWDELVTEFAISNAEWFLVGPGKRLLGFTVQMINTVDNANKVALVEMMASRAQVSAKDKEEVKDL